MVEREHRRGVEHGRCPPRARRVASSPDQGHPPARRTRSSRGDHRHDRRMRGDHRRDRRRDGRRRRRR
ncbi:MAG: hypothetical protein E6G63_04480 [Actinobacteria bacterium]|nr:MAG: hypothetical protein E6G63_04480 [Actinomycetota bacterium]